MKGDKPSVVVISRPALDEAGIKHFLEAGGRTWRRSPEATDAEELVELAGRVCYLSFGDRQSPRSNREYIANLVQKGHESVLEHASWTFLLAGVSRAFTHQLVRHRVGFSYSQMSQQYVDQSDIAVVEPPEVQSDPAVRDLWQTSVEKSFEAYEEILAAADEVAAELSSRERSRAIRSAARSVLPEATSTTIAVTANARALRHFLSIRGSIEGDYEMRVVSSLLLSHLRTDAPSLFADFETSELADGTPIVRHLASTE